MSIISNVPKHGAGDKCPACNSGILQLAVSKFRDRRGNILFWLPCDFCKYKVSGYQVKENTCKPAERLEKLKAIRKFGKTQQ